MIQGKFPKSLKTRISQEKVKFLNRSKFLNHSKHAFLKKKSNSQITENMYFSKVLAPQTILRFSAPQSAYRPKTNLQDWDERNLPQKKPFVGLQELWELNFKICHRRTRKGSFLRSIGYSKSLYFQVLSNQLPLLHRLSDCGKYVDEYEKLSHEMNCLLLSYNYFVLKPVVFTSS